MIMFTQSGRLLFRILLAVMSERYVAVCLLTVIVTGLCIGPVRGQSTTATEYELKAAFIFNFAKYIRWPASSTAEAGKPFIIGIIGKDPFGQVLDDAMRGQRVDGRAVVVKRFVEIKESVNSDILFVASSERANLQSIFSVLRKSPVLTVSDLELFAERGGMIGLITEQSRVRFAINVEAFERVGLKPGSPLLRLARLVTESRSGR
jgi:hypothetical protein